MADSDRIRDIVVAGGGVGGAIAGALLAALDRAYVDSLDDPRLLLAVPLATREPGTG